MDYGLCTIDFKPKYTRDLVLLLHSFKLLETMEVLIKNMLKLMKELTN
jgi:hypothetical protein